jgi:CHAT domain-containing protein
MTSLEVIGGSHGDVINLQPFQVMTSQSGFTAAYGLTTPNGYSYQIPILNFDIVSGYLSIFGNDSNNIVSQTINDNGFYEIDIDGHHFSSDRSSTSFWISLDGATSATVEGINFDGGVGYDTLIVGSQAHSQSFSIFSDDRLQIQGEVQSESIFLKAKDIINQGSVIAGDVKAEFSHSYSDDAEAKIIGINGGNILLNGGKTGDIEVTGQFLATGVTGGKIDFRGKTVNLRGARLDASGENGGGTILIGGDYQGVNSVDSPDLANAETVFVDKYSKIDASAKNNGNGGRLIIWADIDTDFRGDIKAIGGSQAGDGGFVEVSGKQDLNFVGNVDVGATNGAIGSILLDPTDIIIEADDNNDATFDVSNLQKLRGNISLSATNNITFNTEVSLLESGGTVSLVAGNEVRFGRVFETGGRNLSVSAAYIGSTNDYWTFYEHYYNDYSYGESYNDYYSDPAHHDEYLDSYYLNDSSYTESEYYEYMDGYGNLSYYYSWRLPSYISTTSYSVKASGSIKLTSQYGIDLEDISSANLRGNAGNIVLESSYGSIRTGSIYSTAGGGKGGNVSLSASNDVSASDIRTYNTYGNGKGGNVRLVSTDSIVSTGSILSGYGFYANAGDAGDAGAVVVDALSDIFFGSIRADSYNGAGNTVKLTSRQGSINSSSDIQTYSFAADGGNIILDAYQNINIVTYGGEISSYAVNNGKAGVIRITANQDITIGGVSPVAVYASSRGGDGNNITITSVYGGISINGLVSTASLAGGNAGRITLNAAKDIKVGDVFARSRDGNGGAVNIASLGNIETGSITTTSLTGAGGNINISAGGESVKVLNTLKQNDVDYSIISSGVTKNGRITIQRKSGATGSFFAVGDATYNGTKGAISAGKDANGVENSLLATTIVTGTYVDGNIRILNPDIPASSLSKPRTIPPETATKTYTFTTVTSDMVQDFINRGNLESAKGNYANSQKSYENAIVALDNLRTLEFYQSQGITDRTLITVPELRSVTQIKSLLIAGDNATGSKSATKSAMVYTFLSGASLNLFAVTSSSDVIYRTVPLIDGKYQGFTVLETLNDFRAELRDAGSEDYKTPASRLYDLIFKPLKDDLSLSQVNNLIFSTDKLFRTIPLAALYDSQTSKFLVEDFSSSVTPSFQVIEKDRYRSLQGANVLKMGATEAGLDFNPLSSVRTELENIARIELQSSPNIKHSPIYLNKQFSKSNLQALVAKNDSPIVHLATHGIRIQKNLDGFIQLGTTQSANLTDQLTASEIRQLDGLQNKDLLVFSACQTVLHEDYGGYGLAGAAIVAGVKSATGSCWDVSDAGNMILMTAFYQNLLVNGLSKTKALQEAQKSMILGMVRATPVNRATDKLELSIKENKVESSEYGQKDIKNAVSAMPYAGITEVEHPLYWSGTFLVGNPW